MEIGDKDIKYRDSLRNVQSDAQDPASQKYLSREQLTKTLQDAEKKLQEKLTAKEKRNNELVQKQRALIRWAIQIKNVAEDRIGLNEPTPEILLRPPPVSLDQEDDDSQFRSQQAEINRLREKNHSLEANIQELINRKQAVGENQTSWQMKSVHSSQMRNEAEKDSRIAQLENRIAELQDQLADAGRKSGGQSRQFNPTLMA